VNGNGAGKKLYLLQRHDHEDGAPRDTIEMTIAGAEVQDPTLRATMILDDLNDLSNCSE